MAVGAASVVVVGTAAALLLTVKMPEPEKYVLFLLAAVELVAPQVPLIWPAAPSVRVPTRTFNPDVNPATVLAATVRLLLTEPPVRVRVPPPFRFKLV